MSKACTAATTNVQSLYRYGNAGCTKHTHRAVTKDTGGEAEYDNKIRDNNLSLAEEGHHKL